MKKAGGRERFGFQLPAFPTDGQGKNLVSPSAVKQREDALAKEMGQREAASLVTILRNLNRLSSGGHDFSRAIGLGLTRAEEERFASDRSLVRRAMQNLGQVLESTAIAESKLIVREKRYLLHVLLHLQHKYAHTLHCFIYHTATVHAVIF